MLELADIDRGTTQEFPGGLCTTNCDWNDSTLENSGCEQGEECLMWNPTGQMYCFQMCGRDADCRSEEGYSCINLGWLEPLLVCLPDDI